MCVNVSKVLLTLQIIFPHLYCKHYNVFQILSQRQCVINLLTKPYSVDVVFILSVKTQTAANFIHLCPAKLHLENPMQRLKALTSEQPVWHRNSCRNPP